MVGGKWGLGSWAGGSWGQQALTGGLGGSGQQPADLAVQEQDQCGRHGAKQPQAQAQAQDGGQLWACNEEPAEVESNRGRGPLQEGGPRETRGQLHPTSTPLSAGAMTGPLTLRGLCGGCRGRL